MIMRTKSRNCFPECKTRNESNKKLTILMVHNYYQLPGGEDTVVANEKALLESHGHTVILYTRNNSEIKEFNLIQKLCLPISSIFSLRTYREVKHMIKKYHVDMVHVHNTLSLISPAVYYATLHCKVPVVQTLHNYRMLCPGGILYRDGQICEDCLERGYSCAFKHKCYRNSRIQTLVSILILQFHQWTGIYQKLNYICLTEFQKKKMCRCLPEERLFVKPNFTNTTEEKGNEQEKRFYVYVGRMEKEKGVWLLLEAFEQLKEVPLVLIGTGTEEAAIKSWLEEKQMNHIHYLGLKKNVKEYLMQSKALIMPSQCYESFGMTVIESFSCGVPVIVNDLGSLPDFMNNRITGLVFKKNDAESLKEQVLYMENHPEFVKRAGEEAYMLWKENYSEESNMEQLEQIYRKCGNCKSADSMVR